MSEHQSPLIFDGHNDALLKLYSKNQVNAHHLFLQGDSGHLDLPRIRKAGFGGGMFAIFVPSKVNRDIRYEQMQQPSYDLPLPEEVQFSEALPAVLDMASILIRIEKNSNGQAVICKTAQDIRRCFANNTLAMVMHMEGAEAIDPGF